MLPLYFHPIYTTGIDHRANFPRERYRRLADKIEASYCQQEIDLRLPRKATRDEILMVHDVEYTDRFLAGRLLPDEIRRIGLRPWSDAIVDRTLFLTGGSLQALDSALKTGGMAGNLAGGTHHANRDSGSGYCIFNDLAICAEVALLEPQIKRVLILDLDVHQGDGTAKLFSGDDRVLTVSVHAEKNFPARKAQSDIDVSLPTGTEDPVYLQAIETLLARLRLETFDVMFFQAGVDTLAEDKLGLLSLTRAGLRRRNAAVFEFRAAAGVPMVLFMGGGYAEPIRHTVSAFLDLFCEAAQHVAHEMR
ncbi:MAG: histone deacetylase [Fuerstiella sp.]|nr:histone deacetylase [Fuerstiella sp.]